MYLCDNNHGEICFHGHYCPACELREELESKISKLEDKRSELENQIGELEVQIEEMNS
jgi:hypothetical protein